MTRKKPAVPMKRVLGTRQQHELNNLVVAEYTARGETDAQFAAYAETKLGFSVTEYNVAGVRKAWDIPGSRTVARSVPDAALEERVRRLEATVEALQQLVGVAPHTIVTPSAARPS